MGKTRDKINNIEEKCLNAPCNNSRVKIVCKTCEINKEFKSIVGLGMDDFERAKG